MLRVILIYAATNDDDDDGHGSDADDQNKI
jgi:hypothetical protein